MDPGIPVPPKFYGGHERLVYLFAEDYHRLGHQVTLLAGPGSYCSGETFTFGCNNLKRTKWARYLEIAFVWRFLRKNRTNFELVHNFGRLIYLLPILNHPIKIIMSYGRKISPFGIKVINKLPNKNLTFTACSNYCVKTGNVAGTWQTVYNAIDFSKYKATGSVGPDAPLIFLSRLDKVKGAHIAIQVALKTGNKLIIAGNEPSTPDNIDYYQTYVVPFIDQKQIKYVGAVNDLQKNELLGQAKAMLFPFSSDEAFGLVMIESMACGTPVIAFNHAAAPEVIDQGLTGFLVDNEQEMITKLQEVTAINRLVCRQTAEKRFDVKPVTAQYLSLFD